MIKKLLYKCLKSFLFSVLLIFVACILFWLFVVRYPVYAEAPEHPYAELEPDLLRICSCESTGKPTNFPHQFTNGKPTQHHNTNGSTDWGACQINDRTWDKVAQKNGWDYQNNEEDNWKLANYILISSGIQNWKYSQTCWK